MTAANKAESHAIFQKLKSKPANKVCFDCGTQSPIWASITFAVYLCTDCAGHHRSLGVHISFVRSPTLDVWQWEQLRRMKLGGNEAATKYFKSKGGAAALANSDREAKYTSNDAKEYRDALGTRCSQDAIKHPDTVDVNDADEIDETESNSQTPADTTDDFFSSWDKPMVKRPSNPPSGAITPPSSSPSTTPFLTAATINTSRPKSPLNPSASSEADANSALPKSSTASSETATATATASAPIPRTITTSSTIRKTGGTGVRKTNVLGAKKAKLGAKKVAMDIDLDFEEAERAAQEEAEKIAELGFNPNDEAEVAAAAAAAAEEAKKQKLAEEAAKRAKFTAAKPASASKYSSNVTKKVEKTSAEMERLGMGMGRLGFGQAAAKKKKKPATDAKKLSFGQTQRNPSPDAPSPDARLARIADNGPSGRVFVQEPQREEYGDVELVVKDYIRRVGITTAGDVENLKNQGGEFASQVKGAIQRYLNS